MADFVEPQYIRARCALLDALEALGDHRKSITLVGAQAIYTHTGGGDFAVSPFTYDADLAIDPRSLADEPNILDLMAGAGFSLRGQPGLYSRSDGAQVDLLVPGVLGGAGRRGARLGVHGQGTAMKVRGLEGALIDHSPVCIKALDNDDPRSYTIEVAGPSALIVAKIHKIVERVSGPVRRQDDKDAFDVYRVLRAIDTTRLAGGVRVMLESDISAAVAMEAMSCFQEHFGHAAAIGTRMVVRHVEGLEDPDFVSASCVALSRDLLSAVGETM